MNSFYSEDELQAIRFKSVGTNVLISRRCSIYGADKISIGNNVRIDDFCILSGNIILKDYIHISAFCALYGKFGIEIDSYSGLSARSIIYSAMDDFSGEYLINPLIPSELTNVKGGKVILKRFVQLGANCIVFPNVTVNEGVVTGAFSLVNKDLDEWTINVGIPTRVIKNRSKNCIEKLNNFGKL
jgi:acetyltransferase-like isoleucine patch superfamily enzyme